MNTKVKLHGDRRMEFDSDIQEQVPGHYAKDVSPEHSNLLIRALM